MHSTGQKVVPRRATVIEKHLRARKDARGKLVAMQTGHSHAKEILAPPLIYKNGKDIHKAARLG